MYRRMHLVCLCTVYLFAKLPQAKNKNILYILVLSAYCKPDINNMLFLPNKS